MKKKIYVVGERFSSLAGFCFGEGFRSWRKVDAARSLFRRRLVVTEKPFEISNLILKLSWPIRTASLAGSRVLRVNRLSQPAEV